MKNKINYMGIWLFSLVLMLSVGIFSYVRMTYADFNGLTGQIGSIRQVSYYSNYPDEFDVKDGLHTYTDIVDANYFIANIMFKIPSDSYVFYAWNTRKDGSGIFYQVGKFYKMTENLTLYAIWGKNLLGDVNLDGVVDKDDYITLNRYLNDDSFLKGVVLSNADVNLDGKIYLVDIDIIKQACLGTSGYTGLFTNNPVFIYEIYKENNNNSGTGSGTGNGNGTGTGSNSNNNNNNNNSNNNGNRNNNNNSDDCLNNNDYDNKDNNIHIDKDDLKKNNEEGNKYNYVKYLSIFLIGLCFISLRIIIDIIKKAISKKYC